MNNINQINKICYFSLKMLWNRTKLKKGLIFVAFHAYTIHFDIYKRHILCKKSWNWICQYITERLKYSVTSRKTRYSFTLKDMHKFQAVKTQKKVSTMHTKIDVPQTVEVSLRHIKCTLLKILLQDSHQKAKSRNFYLRLSNQR